MALLTAEEVKSRTGQLLQPDDPNLIDDLIAEFEETLEWHTGQVYDQREVTETIDAVGGDLLLTHSQVVSVTSVSVDGTDYTTDQVDELKVRSSGIIRDFNRCGQVTVTYTYGPETAPKWAVRACTEFVRAKVLLSTSDAPRSQQVTDDSGWTYRYFNTEPTGVDEADRIIAANADRRPPGIA